MHKFKLWLSTLFVDTALGTSAQTPTIYSDGVLRIYRLALSISWVSWSRSIPEGMGSSVAKVKAFWALTEATLNEFYMRDIGIMFTIVNDDRLIQKDYNTDPYAKYSWSGKESLISANTEILNSRPLKRDAKRELIHQ